MNRKRAVVSVIGKDQVGIIAKVTTVLAENGFNVLDISQTIVEEFFTMMMVIDVTNSNRLEEVRELLNAIGEEMGVQIHLQLEEVFQEMHRI
ncbi:hypothetical protein N781_16115 [Pontibacillus halophilus JSM 076056 = DSM 19796]|uniref:UPF0237 protein N781_16115 n=1 Tax=Pontibacillus halophilus JSM 076056 = DSM 19796 TaxID=1385510 RepID=A0A0A5GCJ1_9BACI|nr:ACT domain-containing protein [Pontibacillus halophilus]KGX89744.1 hypothetical protein N781_16115 [Pontibacillus halophilus JSM 076056 = DSM 19796]